MFQTQLNYLAVLVSALVLYALGALWYTALFGKRWMQLVRLSEDDLKKGAATAYIWAFITSFVMAYMLARLVAFAGAATFGAGMWYGLVIWIGFVGTSFLTNYHFSRRPTALYFIDAVYYLVGLLIMGGILAVWR